MLKKLDERQKGPNLKEDPQVLNLENEEEKTKSVKKREPKDNVPDLAATFKAQGRAPSMGDEKVEKWLDEHIDRKEDEFNNKK